MSSEEDQWEIWDLLKKLDSVYSEFKLSRPPPLDSKARVKIMRQIAAFGLRKNPHAEERKELKELETLLNPEPDVLNISVSPRELLQIQEALVVFTQFLEAERYLKESVGAKIKSEKRWVEALEIAMLKQPNEKSRVHGADELIRYSSRIRCGFSPKEASEEVFKAFKFDSQEACDKWLQREITTCQKKKQQGIPSAFADLPKPTTYPRTK